ncbi:MAG: SDR family NAD(P)-dependent oxidoreductase [Bryobacteraceae bacterium]|nr:SDR family NAD(P)-dependent oxidoreductase [Bryobacteraceae bacterium]MDW8379075.1 SDR family NAD(P)-dependent oxidoreductase [Bryobacterales bacterium]
MVTGGGSGLGAATVRVLASAGAHVLIVDRNQAAAEVQAAPFENVAVAVADVTHPQQMSEAVEIARSKFGTLDILVNCAGISDPGRVLGKEGPIALERFARVVEVNLLGTFNAIRLAAAVMAANSPSSSGERGVIVNTASIAAFDGQIGQVSYAASKGGIVGMTLPLARDFARHGIRVVTIAPGIFDTPMLAELGEEVRASLAAQVPFPPRLGRPEEYAHLVKAIIENEMLNGEVIRLDGALRMSPR